MKKLKYLSLFTGIGGLDWGLEKLGAQCVGFSEIKESSIRIYQRHYKDRKNFGDITKIKIEELPDFDILTGGFPCQSFSLAGMRKGFSDRRGQMIFIIYDILKAKKPEFAVLENVKGILSHDGGKTFRAVFKLLWSAGYWTRVVLLNAAQYGSAQARERVVFLCRRVKDFEEKNPEITDDTKKFRDIRDTKGPYRYLSEKAESRLMKNAGMGFLMVGGYDRLNTITTGPSSSGRDILVTQDEKGKFRYLTALEAERLQGFPEGWTEGEREADRWFALGNAVNCKVSEYLFTKYLKDLWW